MADTNFIYRVSQITSSWLQEVNDTVHRALGASKNPTQVREFLGLPPSGAVPLSTVTISTTAPLTGGGDLSANRTLAISGATDVAVGVVELATAAEVATLTDTTRVVTPATLPLATDLQRGLVELATVTEANALTDLTRSITPGTVPLASETQRGVVELATAAETTAGTSSILAVHPAGLKVELDKKADIATYAGFTTGDVKFTLKTSETGWILANDGTIGNAASGGTARANADTINLFTLLWNNVSNTHAPVSGGRGASAAADFAANKTIALTKMLGRSLAVAGAGAGLTSRVLGSTLGAETHTLTQAETPLKSHSHTITDPGHTHTQNTNRTNTGGSTKTMQVGLSTNDTDTDYFQSAATGITGTNVTGDATATAHNIMNPVSYLNVLIKL